MSTPHAHAPHLEIAASRSFTHLFAKAKYCHVHTELASDIERAMRELAVVCDEIFYPHETHDIRMEMRDLAASMERPDFVSPERLAQFAQLRATVQGLLETRQRNAHVIPFALTPHAKHEYMRMLLRMDLALVRLKVQVLLQQLGE
jgi:hypothetical protein